MPKTVAIIGAGLAGAACANAFARAGFKVTVFEQGATPAAGASGVPLAMFAPSVSADDAPHSRLLRRGVHVLLDELNRLTQDGELVQGQDWALTGALERCIRGDKKLPNAWLEPQDPLALQSRLLGKPDPKRPSELWHGAAGWVQPAALVAAWLAHDSITLQTKAQILDLADTQLCAYETVIVACGCQTPALLPHLQSVLQPIRGQVEWGQSSDSLGVPKVNHPINGMGHWLEGAGMWLTGATFQRNETSLTPGTGDADLNFDKLARLRPELAQSTLLQLRKHASPWVGVRAAQKNRAPLLDSVETAHSKYQPNVWVSAGLGSRGLSLAAQNAQTLLQKVTRGRY